MASWPQLKTGHKQIYCCWGTYDAQVMSPMCLFTNFAKNPTKISATHFHQFSEVFLFKKNQITTLKYNDLLNYVLFQFTLQFSYLIQLTS
jgi:hypothetical protein